MFPFQSLIRGRMSNRRARLSDESMSHRLSIQRVYLPRLNESTTSYESIRTDSEGRVHAT